MFNFRVSYNQWKGVQCSLGSKVKVYGEDISGDQEKPAPILSWKITNG